MNWSDAIVAAAILLGGPAYIVAFLLVLVARLWIGREGKWFATVLTALLLLLGVVIAVYGLTVYNALVPPGEVRRTVTRNGLAVILSVVPYFIIFSLGPWLLGRRGGPPATLALTPQVIPDATEEDR